MRVSRAQAAENREAVINTASRLFRERGFDGIGIKDLMESAGLTQGAFYKQFASKEDLAAQASGRAFEDAASRFMAAVAANPEDPLGAAVAYYLRMEHRDEKLGGCPIVGLGSDAARQSDEVRASFETGIKELLDVFDHLIAEACGNEPSGKQPDGKALAVLSTMVGAVTLARAVNDRDLAQDFLNAAADQVRAVAAAGKSGTHRSGRRVKQAEPAANARPQRKTKRSQ
jgi:TetR/AcrR family transcriptional repressor of nem operon